MYRQLRIIRKANLRKKNMGNKTKICGKFLNPSSNYFFNR